METRNVIIGLVIIVVLALGGWWLYSSGTIPGEEGMATSTPQGATSTSSTSGSTSSGTKTATLRSLTTQGGNYTCTIDTTPETGGGRTTGTIYSAGGKTRLDLIAQNPNGTNVTIHIIRSGSTAYTWVEGMTTGTKSAITASGAIVPQPSGGVVSISDEATVSSDCHPWSPQASQFVPPAQITFTSS